MAAPRAVRIPRRPLPPTPADASRSVPVREGFASAETPFAPPGEYVPNSGSLTRAHRLLALYLLALVVLYAIFAGLTLASSDSGTRSNSAILIGLAIVGVVLGVFGLRLTVGRTPVALRVAGEQLWVRERSGRVRRFPAPPSTKIYVAERYPASVLSPKRTELVELAPSEGRRRRYVLDRGLLTGTFEQSEP
jgi:hypothetical protein